VEERDFDEFYRATWHRVITFLYAVSGDLSEAQDAAQEAYVRTWQRWSTVSRYDDPEAWVRTVGYRMTVDRWRKARNRVRAHRRHGEAAPVAPPSDDAVALAAALRDLPDRQRQVVALHHLLDLSVIDVAEQVGMSASTVKALLVRGRQALAEKLGTDFPTEVANA
jgi:RNA polymerase sigma-70 factor (sigma-E family)